jgi:hypothetical protein
MNNNWNISDTFMQFLCIIYAFYAFYASFMHVFYAHFDAFVKDICITICQTLRKSLNITGNNKSRVYL